MIAKPKCMYVVGFVAQKSTVFVLCRYSPELQAMLAENVYLTGGNLLYPGVKERVERELLAIRPFQSQFKVTVRYTVLSSSVFICSSKKCLEERKCNGGGKNII